MTILSSKVRRDCSLNGDDLNWLWPCQLSLPWHVAEWQIGSVLLDELPNYTPSAYTTLNFNFRSRDAEGAAASDPQPSF